MSLADEAMVDAAVWLDFDQKMDEVKPVYKEDPKTGETKLRPREGALPFRVWQMYKKMISSLRLGKVDEFLVAGGTMAHYVGDACQPLHISYLHHGADASESGVHSDYETTLLDRKMAELFEGVRKASRSVEAGDLIGENGKEAALRVLKLMKNTVDNLPPARVLEVWRESKGRGKYDNMWKELGDMTCVNIAEGSFVMAILWQSAWKHGGGVEGTPTDVIPEERLQELYSDKKFVPSYRLSDIDDYKSVL